MLKIKTSEDILGIDKKIQKKLTGNISKDINEKKDKIKEIDEILSGFDDILQYRDLVRLKNQRDILEKEVNNILYNEQLYYYLQQTSFFIEKYKKLLKKKISISFVKTKKTKKSKDVAEKESIISNYLKIAREYINIENMIVECVNNKTKCDCGSKSFDTSKDHVRVCINCGEEIDIYGNVSSYSDIERINTSNKYAYDRRAHFRDTVYRYQGTQNNTISQKVYDDLEEQFNIHGLLSSSDVKCEKYKRITKEHINIFLKETGHSKHYEDNIFIWSEMTGNKPPNISDIENKLFEEHEEMLRVYDEEIKTDDRKNFLNAKYVLYQLLLKRNRKCDRYDFNVLKTEDRLDWHNDTCDKIFTVLEWTFTEIR